MRIFFRRFLSTLAIRCLPYEPESRSFPEKLQDNDGMMSHVVMTLTSLIRRSYTAFMRHVSKRFVTMLAMLAGLWFAGAGCGGKTIQYPEDHERYLRIDKAVESLRQAYVGKDASALTALMVPVDVTDRLQREAASDFETFHEIVMDFRIERIMVDNDDVDVYVHWSGLWKKDAEDPGMRHRGHSRLQWVGTKSILLVGMQGDVPFGAKGRQAFISQPPNQAKK